MRRLAQFVRLRASRVSRLSVCVSRLRAFVSRLSRICVCICLACVSRLSASVHVKGSECVRLRLRLVSRLSRICLASVVLYLSASICLASVRLSRVLSRVLSRICLASVSRRSSCLASVCLLVNACGNWLILCRSSFKEFKRFFAIVILSLYI